jgi:cytidine deaminase
MAKTSSKPVFHKKAIAKSLLRKVVRAAAQSYAPYSKINVSAGVYCASGSLYTGVNIENSSYGLTMCAERVAMYNAITAGERAFEVMVVYSPQIEHITPCGACLQVIGEFAPNMIIVTMNNDQQLKFLPFRTLLKQPFTYPCVQKKGI